MATSIADLLRMYRPRIPSRELADSGLFSAGFVTDDGGMGVRVPIRPPGGTPVAPGANAPVVPQAGLMPAPSQGLPSGLGSQSAGIFDAYMRGNQAYTGPTFRPPTFASVGQPGAPGMPPAPVMGGGGEGGGGGDGGDSIGGGITPGTVGTGTGSRNLGPYAQLMAGLFSRNPFVLIRAIQALNQPATRTFDTTSVSSIGTGYDTTPLGRTPSVEMAIDPALDVYGGEIGGILGSGVSLGELGAGPTGGYGGVLGGSGMDGNFGGVGAAGYGDGSGSDGGPGSGSGDSDAGGDGPGGGWAKGGKVTRAGLMGPNPPGPDDGYGALDAGELVVPAKVAKKLSKKQVAGLLGRR